MTDRISQDEINAILWKACDTFRGTVDPSEYKNYILVMLFVKYISEVWLDHYDEYKRRFSDDERRIERWMNRERFGIPYPELSIRSMEKRWGSCSAGGRLILNLKLIQVPKAYIDYVILHELCHLKEHHYGPAFYALMDRLLPDWREKRAALHQVELT